MSWTQELVYETGTLERCHGPRDPLLSSSCAFGLLHARTGLGSRSPAVILWVDHESRIVLLAFIKEASHLRQFILTSSALSGALLFLLTAGSASAQGKARPTARAATTQDVEFDVYLPLQHTDQLDTLLTELQRPGSPNYHKWLTPQQFQSRFGPEAEDIARVADVVRSYGATVTRVHSRGVHVQGKVDAVERTFGGLTVECCVSEWSSEDNGHSVLERSFGSK